jgi:hypothetical protein
MPSPPSSPRPKPQPKPQPKPTPKPNPAEVHALSANAPTPILSLSLSIIPVRFVLSECPRLLVLVEGVGNANGEKEYFWGENLARAARLPVQLSVTQKVVYSPHVYGPGPGHEMPYFSATVSAEGAHEGTAAWPAFPENMPNVWDAHFGHLLRTGATVLVGEWGGVYVDRGPRTQSKVCSHLSASSLWRPTCRCIGIDMHASSLWRPTCRCIGIDMHASSLWSIAK